MSEIEKSSIIIEKEQLLEELLTQKKKVNTQLKRNKTMLKNTKEGIEAIMRTSAATYPKMMQEEIRLKKEVLEALKKIKKSRKVKKVDKEGLDTIIGMFNESIKEDENLMGDTFEDYEKMLRERAEANTDEFDRKKYFDFFEQFEQEVSNEDKKNIRKIYVQLVSRFHPDKARSEKEEQQFHQLMQVVNDAYKRGDIASLLNIQEKYSDKKTLADIGLIDEGAIVDFLDAKIDKEEREIKLLEEQLKRLKTELRELKDTDAGQMYREEKRAQKYGHGGIEKDIEEMQGELDKLQLVVDGLNGYAKTGVRPNLIEEMFFEDSFPDGEEGEIFLTEEELIEFLNQFREDS